MTTRFDLSRPVPILFLGDGCDQATGLGRIGHDLAYLFSSMPEFRVGYMGRALFGRNRWPWASYSFSEAEQWGENRIEEAWDDFAGDTKGIIFTVWDASRMLWFADPVGLPERLQKFLTSDRFDKWGYFMQDSAGVVPERLPLEAGAVFNRYHRVLLASRWAWQISYNTIEHRDLDWMPHGINRNTFKPVDPFYARSMWGLDKELLFGIVASNQERKHWATMLEAIALIPNSALWIHPDRMLGYWNIHALLTEYGLKNRVIVEDRMLSDKDLAMRYSACDATMLISGGEGFGYPVAESLSCGVPVVTGSYGAQAELTHTSCLVSSVAYQICTNHNVRRAVYDAKAVAEALLFARTLREDEERSVKLVEHLCWSKLGIQWKKWARKGLA